MAVITLTVGASSRLGGTDTGQATAATSGNTYEFANDGRTILLAKAATTATLTLDIKRSLDGQAVTDPTISLDTDWTVLGPFPPSIYNNATGVASVSVSANSSLLAVRV